MIFEVAAAQRLNAALKHTHQNRQYPELPLGHKKYREQGNAGVAEDADLNEQPRIVLGGEPAEGDGAGEGHELGQQQRQQQPGGVQTQSSAVGRGHVDDGVNAVDEEEKASRYRKICFCCRTSRKVRPSCRKVEKTGLPVCSTKAV